MLQFTFTWLPQNSKDLKALHHKIAMFQLRFTTKQHRFYWSLPQNSKGFIGLYHKIAKILLFFTTKLQRFNSALPQNSKDFIALHHKIAKFLTTKIAKIASKNRKKVIFVIYIIISRYTN